MIRATLRLALWMVSLAAIALYLALVLRRLTYPLELDCIEGVMMDHVRRLASGQPIFVEPSRTFIPLAYMPGFAALGSLVARVAGIHFWVPRLVSLLATVGIAALIAGIVRAETRSWTPAIAGGALYTMGFGLGGGCYDVARPDSLMLLLALAGLATLRFTRGTGGALGAALLMTLAFFTKQHAAWFVLAALVHLAVNERRRLPAFGLAVALGCGGGYALLAWWLGPWFRFFTLEVPAGWSQVSTGRILMYVGHGVLGTLALLSVPSLLSLARAERPWRGPAGLWMWAGLGALGTGLLATLDPSAYRHVMMPTIVALAVLGPISLHRVTRDLQPASGTGRGGGGALLCALLLSQFVPLLYPARTQLPHRRAAEAHAALLARLRALPGPVLMPYHGFCLTEAGKPTSLHLIALDDILRSRGNRLLRRDPKFFDRLFDSLRAGAGRPAIVTDVPLAAESCKLWRSLDSAYVLADTLGWISGPLHPVTGNQFTPTYVYLPVERDAGTRGAAAGRPVVRGAARERLAAPGRTRAPAPATIP